MDGLHRRYTVLMGKLSDSEFNRPPQLGYASQASIFDLKTGKALKEQGQARAIAYRGERLQRLREIAVEIALSRPAKELTINPVRQQAEREGMDLEGLEKVWGSVFKGKRFAATGRFIASARAEVHSRQIQVFRLK